MTLAGKVALVTGASRGIGRATALELARQGAAVVGVARSEQRGAARAGGLDEMVEQIRALPSGRAHAVRADLGREADVLRAANEALAAFGRVDVLVNNAAYLGRASFTTIEDLGAQGWQRQLFVNLTAPFLLCRTLAPGMKARSEGRIINVTSIAAHCSGADELGGRRPLVYGPSKAALNRLTELLAGELWPANVMVAALDPGSVRSETYAAAAPGLGIASELAVSVEVPARAIAHLSGCSEPMRYSGRVLSAREVLRGLDEPPVARPTLIAAGGEDSIPSTSVGISDPTASKE